MRRSDKEIVRDIVRTFNPIKKCWKMNKQSYDKRGAQTVKNQRERNSGTSLRIYECEFCNHWHLTSK